ARENLAERGERVPGERRPAEIRVEEHARAVEHPRERLREPAIECGARLRRQGRRLRLAGGDGPAQLFLESRSPVSRREAFGLGRGQQRVHRGGMYRVAHRNRYYTGMGFERDLQELERSIERLSREYSAFLYGAAAKAPVDSRRQVEALLRRLGAA